MFNAANTNFKTPQTKKLLLGGAGLIVILMAVAGYFIWQTISLRNSPTAVAEETTNRIVGAVGKLYVLPSDEKPTVAKIQDISKLKDQSFFKNAENDDYLIGYSSAKIAILYREKLNKLVNVAPIVANDTPATTPTPKK